MLTLYNGGCSAGGAKLADSLASTQCCNFILFPTPVYLNRKFSKPQKCKAQLWGYNILVMDSYRRLRQLLRAQYSDSEVEALDEGLQVEEELDGPQQRFRERGEERDYDRDPEFAEILGSCLDDPDKARSKMEERLRKKRNKILQTKTGTGSPMKVIFNK